MDQNDMEQSLRSLMLATVLALLPNAASGSDLVTQEIVLTPGWNAVFLEVQPDPGDPPTVFAGVPVESVWNWAQRDSAVQFLLDPAELEWNRAGWLSYRSAATEALLTNLFSIVANQAYLVKLEGTTPLTWRVQGRPSTRRYQWVADSFNLVGFHVDPASSITLGEYFSPSSAHAGQAMYYLDKTTGKWRFIDDPFSHPARSGEAYWIYCSGGSTYQGPWSTDIVRAGGLDFGAGLRQRLVRFENLSDRQRSIRIRELASASPVPLARKIFVPEQVVFEWRTLSELDVITLAPGATAPLTLAVRRENLTHDAAGSVLELTDGMGIRWLVPVRARR